MVPRPAATAPRRERAATATQVHSGHAAAPAEARAAHAPPRDTAPKAGTSRTPEVSITPTAGHPRRPAAGEVLLITPNVISLPHWQRLHEGALLAASPHVDWASLLQRTFEVDVLACAHCGGRLRVLSVLTEPEPVRRILEHLGMPADQIPLARARDPTDEADDATCADEPM